MPVQRIAEPAVSEFSERRARLDSILIGFGFDPALIGQKLWELHTPLGPSEYRGGLSAINADSTANDKAYAIAAWIWHSRYGDRTYTGMDDHGDITDLRGLDALCMDDRTLNGAIYEIFRGSYYMGGAFQINGKAESFFNIESEKYGLTTLKEASLFQLWASQQGVSQEYIDVVGAQLFGAEWEYGRIAGSRFSQQRDGTYYFKTDDAIDIRQTYISMVAAPAEAAVSAIPVRTGEVHHETLEEQFERFYAMESTRIFSGNVDSFFGDDSKKYRREHRREGTSLTEENLRKATLFYIWATGMDQDSHQPRISAEEMETMGAQFGGVWEFGKLTAENLMMASTGRNAGKFVFETGENVQAVRDGFATLAVPRAGEEATTTVASAARTTGEAPAETTGLAAIAQSVGVTEDYLRDAVQLMVDRGAERVKIAYDRSDVGEEGTKPVTRDRNGYYVLLFHRPEGSETAYTDSQLTDAVNKAADVIHPGSRQA